MTRRRTSYRSCSGTRQRKRGLRPPAIKAKQEYLSKIDSRKDLTISCQACMVVLSKGKEDGMAAVHITRTIGSAHAMCGRWNGADSFINVVTEREYNTRFNGYTYCKRCQRKAGPGWQPRK